MRQYKLCIQIIIIIILLLLKIYIKVKWDERSNVNGESVGMREILFIYFYSLCFSFKFTEIGL